MFLSRTTLVLGLLNLWVSVLRFFYLPIVAVIILLFLLNYLFG